MRYEYKALAGLEPLPQGETIVVAMSGGVDSSVAAALLKEAGNEVIGVTLRLFRCAEVPTSRSCCGTDAVARARAVAARLGIRHYELNCGDTFEHEVLRVAWQEYARGRTPSPCLLCNERIKFGELLTWARRVGATRLATGHYARKGCFRDGSVAVLRGVDLGKDQSYFLSVIEPEALGWAVFPLGQRTKQKVRALGRLLGLPSADARESQDACLGGENAAFAEMLRERFGAAAKEGNFVTEDGICLGHHGGVHRFTVGQRRGLGITAGRPLWVKRILAEQGTVVLTDNPSSLACREFGVTGLRWLVPRAAEGGTVRCTAKVRSRSEAAPCEVVIGSGGTATVTLETPVAAVTPGQAAVFYDGDLVLGRGWIDAV